MVRVAFRFCKEGDLAYISHLDLQRTMHRAVKRAQLPVEYSKGFHALPLVNFAHALGVGCTSEGECMEIVLKDGTDYDLVMDKLNAVFPVGLHISQYTQVDEKSASLMALVGAARWRVAAPGVTQQMLDALKARPEIRLTRTTKRGVRELDIAPGLLELTAIPGGFEALLSSGSVLNIRPEEVLTALGIAQHGQVHRLELYAAREGAYVPLMKFLESELF